VEDRALGLRRARASTLLLLALPGSAYVYQGEELGLFEVAALAPDTLQDPIWERTAHASKGRDGCRVPLPWSVAGSSFGFGAARPHLPQPIWFGASSVQAEDGLVGSTLELYRQALALRRELQGEERLEWVSSSGPRVLHFTRPGGWHSITNFGDQPVPLPAGRVVLSSAPLTDRRLPGATTVWITE
jgi:alpha-glucosidase